MILCIQIYALRFSTFARLKKKVVYFIFQCPVKELLNLFSVYNKNKFITQIFKTIFFLFLRGGQVFIFIIAQSVGVYEGGGCVRVFKMENGTDVAVSFLSFSPFWARPGAITPT